MKKKDEPVPSQDLRGRVKVEPGEGAVQVRWQRGPLNIFDSRLLRDLAQALKTPEVLEARAVVLRGDGGCWSAGFAVEDHLRPKVREMMSAFREALAGLRSVPAPTIAEVEGHCLGGGLELLMACDLALGASSATFGQPEIRLGVFPPFGVATYERLLGPRQARELLFLGSTVDAQDALRLGILNRVVPDGQLGSEVAKIARTLSSYRPATLRLQKRLMGEDQMSALVRAESSYLNELMAAPDAEDGLKRFLEKRAAAPPSTPAARSS